MQKKFNITNEQAEALFNLIDNPVNVLDGNPYRDILKNNVFEHVVNKKRKSEIFEQEGVIEEDFDVFMDELREVHSLCVNPAYPTTIVKGSVPFDVFDAVIYISTVDSDLVSTLKDSFVNGKKIEMMGDTKEAMLRFSESFKAINQYRDSLLQNDTTKDMVNVKVNEKAFKVNDESVMYI